MATFGIDPHEVSAVIATFAIILGCTILGAQIGLGGSRIAGADTMVGLGLAGGLISAFAGMISVPLSVWMVMLGLGVAAGGVRLVRRRIVPGGKEFWLSVAMLIPFLAVAAAAPATMWDDFYHWLPNAAYAYRFDSLARPGLPETLAKWPAYPQTMPFLTLAASRLDGRFLECAGPIANLLILGSFAAALVHILGEFRPHPTKAKGFGLNEAGLAGLALMAVTLLNPGFDRDVVMSSYADATTGVAVALCGLLGCLTLERLAEGRCEEARMLAWRFAFVAAVLVNLKQSNSVLLALMVTGFALVVGRCPALRTWRLASLILVMLGPSMAVWLGWRIYVILNLSGGEMAFRSPWQWNWAQVPEMLSSIWETYSQRPVFYAVMTGMTIAGLAMLRHPTGAVRKLLAVTAICWVGYNVFLVLVYLGAMTAEEAANAAAYWRYMPHIGLLGTSAAAVAIVSTTWPARIGRRVRAVGVVSLVAFPLIVIRNAEELSPLSKTWSMHLRQVGTELADILPMGARLVVISGVDHDPMAVAIKYDLWRPGREDRDLRVVYEGEEPALLRDMFSTGRATHLLLTGTLTNMDTLTEPLGMPAVGKETMLLGWDGEGWHRQRSWPMIPVLGPNRAPSNEPEDEQAPRIAGWAAGPIAPF